MGPKAPSVTFQAGTLGGIGESIAVGRAVNIDGNVYINFDSTFMPANDYIVGYGIVPVGRIDIFIGYTLEAYVMQRILLPTPSQSLPTTLTDLNLPPLRSPQTQIQIFATLPAWDPTPSHKATTLNPSFQLYRRMRRQIWIQVNY